MRRRAPVEQAQRLVARDLAHPRHAVVAAAGRAPPPCAHERLLHDFVDVMGAPSGSAAPRGSRRHASDPSSNRRPADAGGPPRQLQPHAQHRRGCVEVHEVCETIVSVRWVLVVMATMTATPALLAYERLAPVYDASPTATTTTAWVGRLERIARDHGLSGRRALDVGVRDRQELRAAAAARLRRVGLRPLPRDGRARAPHARWHRSRPRARRRHARHCPNLARSSSSPASTTRSTTCSTDADLLRRVRERRAPARAGRRLRVRRQHARDVPRRLRAPTRRSSARSRRRAGAARRRRRSRPGAVCSAVDRDRRRRRRSAATSSATTPSPTIRHALTSAGLACRAVLGQSTGGVLHEDADEDAHTKLVYVAGRAG